jgi:Cft2 family RNA processing exonuclease
MKIILRPIFATKSDPKGKKPLGYRKIEDADVVIATANACTGGPLAKIANAYGWNEKMILSASKKSNRRKCIAVIETISPSLIIVPKTLSAEQARDYTQIVLEEIKKIDARTLNFTHFGFNSDLLSADVMKTLVLEIKAEMADYESVAFLDVENQHIEQATKLLDS